MHVILAYLFVIRGLSRLAKSPRLAVRLGEVSTETSVSLTLTLWSPLLQTHPGLMQRRFQACISERLIDLCVIKRQGFDRLFHGSTFTDDILD